jgi:hypothetical protein
VIWGVIFWIPYSFSIGILFFMRRFIICFALPNWIKISRKIRQIKFEKKIVAEGLATMV